MGFKASIIFVYEEEHARIEEKVQWFTFSVW